MVAGPPVGGENSGENGGQNAAERERILSAAVRVMERTAPEAPRVSDIIAEAESSNKAFYRLFDGKDDLVMAVMTRGVELAAAEVGRRMDAEPDPIQQITRWIESALAQAADPRNVTISRAALGQLSLTANRPVADGDIMAPMRGLLAEPVAALGKTPQDAELVFLCTMGTLRRYYGDGRQPAAADVAHLVAFCLRGLRTSPPTA